MINIKDEVLQAELCMNVELGIGASNATFPT